MSTREEILTESLRCTLTDKEKIELADKQAQDLAELGRLDDRLKGVSGQIKAQIKEVEARVKATAETIRNGYLYRDVEVLKIIDVANDKVRLYRKDTGECYSERALFPSERQMVLEVKRQTATETIEEAQKKEVKSEPLTQSAGETTQESPTEGQRQPLPPQCDTGPRPEAVDQSSVVSVTVNGAQEPMNVQGTHGESGRDESQVTASDLGPEDFEGEASVVNKIEDSQVCQMCHWASVCTGCCEKCPAKCNKCQHCGLGDDEQARLSRWQAWESLPKPTTFSKASTFDKDAQAFLDGATPLQKEVILDPVKTRDEMVATGGAPVVPAPESKEPEKPKAGKKGSR